MRQGPPGSARSQPGYILGGVSFPNTPRVVVGGDY